VLIAGRYYSLLPGELYALYGRPKIFKVDSESNPDHKEEYEYDISVDNFVGVWSTNEMILIIQEPIRIAVMNSDDWFVHYCYQILHPFCGMCYFLCNVDDKNMRIVPALI